LLTFDPFARGYARSLAHPGGNITGIFSRQIELAAKRVEFIREALPQAHRVALLWDSAAKEDAQAGALLSYGVSLRGALREVADYLARIANGARPSDLPIEQPRSFELLVKLRTAKALGIAVPPTLLARADEVIE